MAIYSATSTGPNSYLLSSPITNIGIIVERGSGPSAIYSFVSLNDQVTFQFAGFDNANGALYSGVSGTANPGRFPSDFSQGTVEGKLYFISNMGGLLDTTQTVVSDPNGTALPGLGLAPPCYVAGTRILTTRGEVAVESIRPGDILITLSGKAPVVWAGHRSLNFSRDPVNFKPVRIEAGAFGRGLPTRDLLLSPDHSVFHEGLLIPVHLLVNGATITVEAACKRVTYWHLELERHDVIIAEGMLAESYLDTGNRAGFDGPAAAALKASADADLRRCAPTVTDGTQLQSIRTQLAQIAAGLGRGLSDDPTPRLIADGRELTPEAKGRTLSYVLPAGTNSLRLRSRSAIPSEMWPGVSDPRQLGLGISGIRLDGADIALDSPCLTDGWHAPERHGDPDACFRWTDGNAGLSLPTGRTLEIEVGGEMLYRTDRSGVTLAM